MQVKITYNRPINRTAAHPNRGRLENTLNLCCAECGAEKTPKGKPLLACAGCKEVGCRQARTSASRARGLTCASLQVFYCSEQCQKKGWVEGHNKLCKGKKKKKKKAPKRK